MSGSIRRCVASVSVAAALAVGLSACGPMAGEPQAGSSVTKGTRPAPTTGTDQSTLQPVISPLVTPTTPATSPSATVTPQPSTAQPTPTTSTPPKTAPPKTVPPKTVPSKSPQPVRTDLRTGDKGPKVLALQKRLSALGYWLGQPDGHFGSLTKQAVYAVQKTAGLPRDGKVGAKTQRALDNGVRPRTQLSGSGIDIDLKRQILMVVRGGQVKYTLNTSTGGGYKYESKNGNTHTARTPKGTFTVYHAVDGADEGFLGTMWRPRYFHGGYAVHGSPSIPAYPASHGCARVSNAAMNMIWAQDFMPKGGTVLVR